MDIFEKIDTIRLRVESYKKEPLFSDEVQARNKRYETTITAEKNNLLRVMASLIAYSNNAPSDKVFDMLERGTFEKVFANFDLDIVASMNPQEIIAREWHNIRVIRFMKKVEAIARCAKLLTSNNRPISTIDAIYKSYNIPNELKSEADITIFWEQFDKLYSYFSKIDMPYFKNDTTLLHLLLHLGFPCIKPDLIVMKVAATIGIIKSKDNHNTYSKSEKKLVVSTIQKYCLFRNIKPAVMDFYILIFGGQKDALKFVKYGYTPLVI